MDAKISKIIGREILDSRGDPTIEVEVEIRENEHKIRERAGVPSGASTGKYEAVELRDNEKRYHKKGVLKAVRNVNEIISKNLQGKNLKNLKQEDIDKEMIKLDKTKNKQNLGANAILGVSLAIARSYAKILNVPLYKYISKLYGKDEKEKFIIPVPMMNILNGGVHANWQASDFQEYMIVPYKAKNFKTALQQCSEIYHELKSLLKRKNFNTGVGDEGGFVVNVKDNEMPINLIVEAINNAGYSEKEIGISLDVAASAFYDEDKKFYNLHTENLKLTNLQMVERYENIIEKYNIISIEDGLSEEDYDGWKYMNERIGKKVICVGDDLFVTNVERIEKGIKENLANAVLIKLNQIGTLTETINAIKISHKANFETIISHRSGETVDSFISDLSVGTNSKFIKSGAPCRGERVEKYNQMLRIEEELMENDDCIYAGEIFNR